MEAEVITKIDELVRAADGKVVEIDGLSYTTTPLFNPRTPLPEPDPLVVHTLRSLAEYLKDCPDQLDPATHRIHVVGPNEVRVVSMIHGHFNQRYTYVRALSKNHAESSPLFSFGKFLPAEEMVIALQSLFVDDGDRAKVLSLCGVVNDQTVKTQSDDGVTQAVKVNAGLTFKEEMEIPNPVLLFPYRTFREVDQPPSEFILRGKPGGQAGALFALFEAEGRFWELEAVKLIHEWLEDRETGFRIIS